MADTSSHGLNCSTTRCLILPSLTGQNIPGRLDVDRRGLTLPYYMYYTEYYYVQLSAASQSRAYNTKDGLVNEHMNIQQNGRVTYTSTANTHGVETSIETSSHALKKTTVNIAGQGYQNPSADTAKTHTDAVYVQYSRSAILHTQTNEHSRWKGTDWQLLHNQMQQRANMDVHASNTSLVSLALDPRWRHKGI
ncbi:hypothetical protein TgHK011_009121 [Trichoderma gracile]|nr:hypothetical protein TgHK011_009121 [Trichoderma gracile]